MFTSDYRAEERSSGATGRAPTAISGMPATRPSGLGPLRDPIRNAAGGATFLLVRPPVADDLARAHAASESLPSTQRRLQASSNRYEHVSLVRSARTLSTTSSAAAVSATPTMARTAAPAHGGRRQEEALAPYEGQARRAPTEHPGREGGIAEAKNTQLSTPARQDTGSGETTMSDEQKERENEVFNQRLWWRISTPYPAAPTILGITVWLRTRWLPTCSGTTIRPTAQTSTTARCTAAASPTEPQRWRTAAGAKGMTPATTRLSDTMAEPTARRPGSRIGAPPAAHRPAFGEARQCAAWKAPFRPS